MKPVKVLTVFGTRPEAVKMAPLVLELAKSTAFEQRVCVTAQHRGMLDDVLGVFSITPDYDLEVMTDRQTLCSAAARIFERMEPVLRDFEPELTLVHGDTLSAVIAAQASFYCGARVGHVEAGLRTFDKLSPFPEEMNRVLITRIADLHFCPTRENARNLELEGVRQGIHITGNTVIDALRHTVRADHVYKSADAARAVSRPGRLVFLTAHRRENLGQNHRCVFRAVVRIALDFPDVTVLYPVHPNPAVRDVAREVLSGHDNIILTEPLTPDDAHNVMGRSFMLLTDSGGLQEEGPALRKPVLVLRTETERPEAVAAGTVRVCGVDEQAVYDDCRRLLNDAKEYDRMANAVNPYGDGHACPRIAKGILQELRG